MDGLAVHEKVIKVYGKEVVEQAQPLSGGDEAKKSGATVPVQLAEVARLKATDKAESVPTRVEKESDAFLRQSKVELAAEENALDKEIHEMRQRLRKRQRQLQLQELEAAEAKLKVQLKGLEQKQLTKKIEEGEAVAKAQQHTIQQLQNALLQIEKGVLELQDEIKRLNELTAELRQTENDGEKNIAALKETLEKQIEEEHRLRDMMASAKTTLEEQHDRLLDLETTLTEQRIRVDETGCRRQRLEEELQTARKSLRPHEEQLKYMEQLLAETKDVVGILEGTIADNRRKEAELTKAKEETEAKNQLMEKKLAEINIMVNHRDEEHKKLEWRDAKLRAELQQLTTNHKLLQLDVEKLREHMGRATHEREHAQAQLDAILPELFQQTKTVTAAKAALDALREKSTADLAAAREEICSLEEELAQARDKQQSLEVDLEQQRQVKAAAVISSEKIQMKKKGWFTKN